MSGFQDVIKQKTNSKQRKFNIYINEGEVGQIHEWVLKKDNVETGGDLFGLWIDKHTAAVQFVLGPGKDCSRTSTSFFQDTNYLERTGKYFTKNHGLCNIGQWHSHHRLTLREPSRGDEDTVWGNMPGLGMNRFMVFIANIKNSKEVTVNCFLFEIGEKGRLPVLKGKLNMLQGNSPFRLNESVLQEVHHDAESFNDIQLYKMERWNGITENKSGQSSGTDLIQSESKPEETKHEKDHGNKSETPILNGFNEGYEDANTKTKPKAPITTRRDDGEISKHKEDGKKKELAEKHGNNEVTHDKVFVIDKHGASQSSNPSSKGDLSNKNRELLKRTSLENGGFCFEINKKDNNEDQQISSEKALLETTTADTELGLDRNHGSSNVKTISVQPNGRNYNSHDQRSSTYDNVQGLQSNEDISHAPDTPSGTMSQPNFIGKKVVEEDINNDNVEHKKDDSDCCFCLIL